MLSIAKIIEQKFTDILKEKIFKFYFDLINIDITNLSLHQLKDFISQNIEIEQRLYRLLDYDNDRFLCCIYEYLSLNGTATYPQLYSHFRMFYLKKDEELSERYMRREFRDRFTILENHDIIFHDIVIGQKGTQNFFIAPFCSKQQYKKATKFFKQYMAFMTFQQSIFYIHKSKNKENEQSKLEENTTKKICPYNNCQNYIVSELNLCVSCFNAQSKLYKTEYINKHNLSDSFLKQHNISP